MNQYISYLDEAKLENRGNIRRYTIASMTASRDSYINDIEVKWKAHRSKFGIPNGQDIHFANVKYLLNTSPGDPFKPEWVAVFGDAAGGIDYAKMHAFYTETLQIIAAADFVVQITDIEWDAGHFSRQRIMKDESYFPPFITFKEHLDLMGLYLLGVHAGPYRQSHIKITKLRYDGDVGLQERDDIKRAYHQTMSVGTRHFKPETALKLFDEVRFINKHEIGHEGVTHAGSEIIDFIATIAARDIWQIPAQTNMIPIRVPGMAPIDPLPIVKSKIIHTQKIKDFYY